MTQAQQLSTVRDSLPTVSVVIPAYNAEDFLRECLEQLRLSDLQPAEVIVADDASTDNTAAIALALGARVVSCPTNMGPARARNLAAMQARGDVLFFIDSDVLVRPDTVRRIAETLAKPGATAAVIGSYDDSPGQKNFLSQYRNLLHCFVHQTGRRQASTFWTGCGAVRTSVFRQMGGFSESYEKPSIEDIELGYRMSRAGHRIVLDPEIQVKHLKKWGFFNLIRTDVTQRAIPWTELILRDEKMPDDLNLQTSQRASVALVLISLLLGLVCAWYLGGHFVGVVLLGLFFVLGHYWLEAIEIGSWRVLTIVALLAAGVAYFGYLPERRSHLPVLGIGAVLLFIDNRFWRGGQRKPWRVLLGIGVVTLIAGTIATSAPRHPLVLLLVLVLVTVLALNYRFYMFLFRRKGIIFTVAVTPFHLLYHLYSGLAFAYVLARQTLRRGLGTA